ncbi:MAG: sulfatase-like hydrolase/transferase, partial [Gemmatimonadota bacterium]|nr:sulfatase-like hydrolase/transferase [Gemmatimonadota bacterium]
MSDKPNFIVFMSDDQGHRDLSCMGATDFQTPNFDRIASRGAKLTRWYSNAPIYDILAHGAMKQEDILADQA